MGSVRETGIMSTGVYRTTTWALCDQAIVSGGNFLTNLVLIRTLAPSSYGGYALLLNAMLFANSLHTNMVAYSVCVRGAQSDDEALRGVATGGLIATLSGVAINAVLITAACFSIHRSSLIPIVVGAVLFWQLQETLRTVFVSRLAYRRALAGDALSYLGQAALVAAVCCRHEPSLFFVFAVILVSSLLAGIVQAVQIRPNQLDGDVLQSFFRELWRLGKWNTLAKVVAFFTFQVFPWLLAYRSGLAAVASLQSLYQLVALANPLLLGFNNLIIASIAGRKRADGVVPWTAAAKQIRLAAILLGSYFAVLAICPYFFMRMLYGSHSPYLANASLLRYFALAYALEALAMIAGAVLGGLGETRFSLIAQMCAMATSVLIVFPWIIHSGLRAAVLGLVLVAGTRATAALCLAHRGLEKESRATLAGLLGIAAN
jgi:O-antigen/teichoic acid export membrane protein